MALYLDVESETEPSIELARFVSKLKSKGKETVENLIDESAKNSEAEILNKLLNETSILFTDASDKEVEGFYFLVTAIAKKLGDAKQYFNKIVETVVSNTQEKTLLRLRVLNNLYNTLPADAALKYKVYTDLLRYAVASHNSEFIYNQIKESDLDAKVADWNLDAKQKRDLFAQIREMSGATKSNRTFKWSVKYLTSLSGDAQDLDEAVKVVVEAIRANNLFQFETLLNSSVPIVSKLESSSNINHRAAYKLLNIFVNGTQETYQQFTQEFPSFISTSGLNADDVLRKIRLLSLATLVSSALSQNTSSSAPEIAYSQVAKSLNVPEGEVETWVISAISEKIITARMDQLRRVILVTGALQRVFTEKDWKQVGDALTGWRKNVKVMLNTLQESKKQNPAQQHAAMTRALQNQS